ncbi:MAG: hypothetical protein JEZ02_03885 [Desulfatibacillum sp.]|nr:hypothetical protein [Desulfatibacillum sp.]
MKSRRGLLFFALLMVFLLGQFAYAGPPLKLQAAPPLVKKEFAKQIPLVDPNLSIMGIQTRNTQTLSQVQYEVKIKNETSSPYSGHAKLALDVKHVVSGQQIIWEEGAPVQEIAPLAPGEEKVFRGQCLRKGSVVSLKASIKTNDKVWTSKTVKVVEMPTPELEITNVEIRDGKIYATVKNNSDYDIDSNGGLTVQFYGGVKQADNTVEFSPAGGYGVRIRPHSQFTQSATLREGFDVYKVTIFLSRGVTNITAAYKVINL